MNDRSRAGTSAKRLAAVDLNQVLVYWYNEEHRHSAIGILTPQQRPAQLDHSLLNNRAAAYAAARDRHPRRRSGRT